MFQNAAEKGWIADEAYRLKWFSVEKDGPEEIGHIDIQVIVEGPTVTTISTIFLKGIHETWTDYSIAEFEGLKPLLHTSLSPQRDLKIRFGKRAKGVLFDKGSQGRKNIDIGIKGNYFDSAMSHHLVRWSDIEERKIITIPMFNYQANKKAKLIAVKLFDIKKTEYSLKDETLDSWHVKSTSGITNHQVLTEYTIGRSSRKILRMDIANGARKSFMERT
ncbi:DUF3108 domain-containing protein [Ulvibacterium marinum]|nr:hypothetical protein [Ulvibacterium marinum]